MGKHCSCLNLVGYEQRYKPLQRRHDWGTDKVCFRKGKLSNYLNLRCMFEGGIDYFGKEMARRRYSKSIYKSHSFTATVIMNWPRS